MVSEREKLDREMRNNRRALLGYGVLENRQVRKPVRLTRRTKRRLLRNGYSLDEYERTRVVSTDEDDTDTDSNPSQGHVPRTERARAAVPNEPAPNVRRNERVGAKRSSERIANQQEKNEAVEKSGENVKPTDATSDSTPTKSTVATATHATSSTAQDDQVSDDEVVFVKEIRCPPPKEPEDEVVFVAVNRNAKTRPVEEPKKAPGSSTESSDEVQTVGIKVGVRPNIDYPHLRFSCGLYKFAPGAAAYSHCDKCYCYICDEPVAQCKDWDVHCQATDKSPMFRRLRTEFRTRRSFRQRLLANAREHASTPRRNGDAAVRNAPSEHGDAPSSVRYETTSTTESQPARTSRTGMVLRSHARENPCKRGREVSDNTRPARRQRRS